MAESKEMRVVDPDNTAYLKTLVTEVGWLDFDRFGGETALGAFLLMQHSGDISLMKAALPELKKEIAAHPGVGNWYALTYDRLQVFLGGKQRYGTQSDYKDGEDVLFPLEDESKVEEFRKEMGMPPLQEKKEGNKTRIMKHW
ncbi:MAG: hypothetical protein GY765_17820 [bacterium]|nr:hypothetical protein [bacterium]